jgi:hypothetical protein
MARPKLGESRARREVYRRSRGLCEARYRHCLGWASEWHHRRNQGQGGPWCPSNGLHLCASCHRWVTAHPTGAKARGWSVSAFGPEPATVAVRHARYGRCWLNPDGSVDRDQQEVSPWGGL